MLPGYLCSSAVLAERTRKHAHRYISIHIPTNMHRHICMQVCIYTYMHIF